MYFPTETLPVKVIRSILGWVIIASPMSWGKPVITWNISGGIPASYKTSASSKAVKGVFSVGLQTMRLLVAMLGAILCATMLRG